ncbi:hypothetical protein LNKW23_27090 [Paralimibaculum aggregatum]|uniref:LysM domain-containing protein n=1 Tax=Paralimibaculum aggregatum TaxID=3036245 RepID=A0ABQ6LR52_9RHOB|nr:hypothetical protein [Limibaculum sp. NKW23]GMG83496.1 hypothetical protein LNKW23_27090 [Limibaculum sp. NKW23]
MTGRSGQGLAIIAVAASLAITAGTERASAQSRQIPCGEFYDVQPGDTLREIALDAYTVGNYQIIFDANRDILSTPSLLLVGQRLFIPCLDGSGPRTRQEAETRKVQEQQAILQPPEPSAEQFALPAPVPQPSEEELFGTEAESTEAAESTAEAAAGGAEPAPAAAVRARPRRVVRTEVIPQPETVRLAMLEAATSAPRAEPGRQPIQPGIGPQPGAGAPAAQPAATTRQTARQTTLLQPARAGGQSLQPGLPAPQPGGTGTGTGSSSGTTTSRPAPAGTLQPAPGASAAGPRIGNVQPAPGARGTSSVQPAPGASGAAGSSIQPAPGSSGGAGDRQSGLPAGGQASGAAASDTSAGAGAADAAPTTGSGESGGFDQPVTARLLPESAPRPLAQPAPDQPIPRLALSLDSGFGSIGGAAAPNPDAPAQAAAAAPAKAAPIRLLTGSYPPYTGQDLPERGMLTDVVLRAIETAAPAAETQVAFINDWNAHLSILLPQGAFDLGFPWLKPNCDKPDLLNQELRSRCTDFAWSQPLHEVVIGYFVKSGTPLEAVHDQAELAGLTFCRPAGMQLFDLEQRGLGADAVTLVTPDTAAECLAGLVAGEIDVVSLSVTQVEGELAEAGLIGQVAELPELADILTLHVISPRSSPLGQSHLALINRGLSEMRESGEWFEVVSRHLAGFTTGTQ